jgi:arylsulfatase A-like enzyme
MSGRFENLSRRDLLKISAAPLAAPAAGFGMPAVLAGKRPNFLFIITDQQSLDAISAHGCADVRTPNIDRLVRGGVSFRESYTAFPLCSPARSCMFTGRMPSETGVVKNSIPIHPSVPDIGHWLGQEGYDTIYAGKWHMREVYTDSIPGFTVLPGGLIRQGQTGDSAVSRSCQAYLSNRTGSNPFLLIASFLQPHDICAWVADHFVSKGWESMPEIQGKLPALPTNFHFDPREPAALKKQPRPQWSDEQWRFYLWSYYRHVEMVDAEVGRVMNALEDSGDLENTVVLLTTDHGEGGARHHKVLKNYLYDEAAKVPFIVSCPGRIPAGKQDLKNLVSGLDIMPTLCDYAKVNAPPDMRGRSLRPLIDGKRTEWREFVAAEVVQGGHMIRTPGHKYVAYDGDPVEQLFDMRADPGETRNLAMDTGHAAVLAEHQKLLKQWEGRLKPAPKGWGLRRSNNGKQ